MIRNMVRSVNSREVGPLTHYFGHKICSLVRDNAVWNRHPINHWVVVLAKALHVGKANPYPKLSVCTRKDKPLFFSWWQWYKKNQSGTKLQADSPKKLFCIGNSVLLPDVHILGIQQWLQISIGEWESLMLSPCITSTPATMATLFMTLLGNGEGWLKKVWLESIDCVILLTWLLNFSHTEATFW